MSTAVVEQGASDYWAARNPLLGSPVGIVKPEDEILVSGSGHLAVALRTTTLDPERDLEATWGAVTTVRALPLFDRPPSGPDFQFLLTALRSRVPALLEPDACLSVSWPSVPGSEFPVDLGFRRLTNLAVCPIAEAAISEREPVARVTEASSVDIPVVAEYWRQLVEEESTWEAVHPRPSTAALLLGEVKTRHDDSQASTLVAYVGERAVGFIAGHRVARRSSIGARTSLRRVFYIDAIYVARDARRAGIGTALVSHCFHSVAARGVDGWAVHYSELSPMSRPFWAKFGFRALWETWRMTLTPKCGTCL